MDCELCSTSGRGNGITRCQRCGFDTTLPPDIKRFLISLVGFRPGELLEGRYRIDRILGYGGMSVVYKAHDEVLREEVAIKVINRGRIGDDNKLITDIRRDIVTTRKLAHPDIVKIYDFHKTDVCGFLTMEFVPGNDLASLISERGRLGEGDVCRIAAQVAEALQYAHANGVIHCDIKPGNLLLAENGRVKIADFGISRLMHEESSGLTGLVVGTPAYMAPEQIRGERPTPRTDMYALGIVMWQCLMGSPPFTKGDIAYQHVHAPLPPLTDVSPELERIVRRAAGKAMDDRYPSMAVMAQELNDILRKMTVVVEATLVQTAPPGPPATLLQAPPLPLPLPAGTVAQTPSPEPAGTVAQTRLSEPAATVAQAPPPEHAGTVAQTRPPAPSGTVVEAPPASAGTAAQTILPTSALTPESALPRQPEVAAAAGAGGRVPPAADGPAGGKGQPPPASPPASSKTRIAAVAAVVVLLAGAAAWGLFSRSPQPVNPQQPLLASGGGLPPVQSPATTPMSTPPPELPAPGATPPVPPRQTAAGAGAGAAAGAAGAMVAAVDNDRAGRPAAVPRKAPGQTAAAPPDLAPAVAPIAVTPPPASTVSPPVSAPTAPRGAELQSAPPLRTGTPKSGPAAVPAAPVAAAPPTGGSQPQSLSPPSVSVDVQPTAPASAPTPAAPPVAVRRSPVQPPAPVAVEPAPVPLPVPGPTTKPAAPEPEQAPSAPPPAVKSLDLTPILITSLPRGRWCDVQVRAVGTGLPMSSARSEGERRLTAERSADLDAYRRIAENVKGIQVSGGSTVKDFVTTDASYKTKTDALIRGARRVDSQKNIDGTWSVVMELNLSGMCDVIQVGSP